MSVGGTAVSVGTSVGGGRGVSVGISGGGETGVSVEVGLGVFVLGTSVWVEVGMIRVAVRVGGRVAVDGTFVAVATSPLSRFLVGGRDVQVMKALKVAVPKASTVGEGV